MTQVPQLKTGDRVAITMGERTVPGVVFWVSQDAQSLALEFEADGKLLLHWRGDAYLDRVSDTKVTVEKLS